MWTVEPVGGNRAGLNVSMIAAASSPTRKEHTPDIPQMPAHPSTVVNDNSGPGRYRQWRDRPPGRSSTSSSTRRGQGVAAWRSRALSPASPNGDAILPALRGRPAHRSWQGRGVGHWSVFPKSRVPEGKSFYTRCCNLSVQGACADASMLALAAVDAALLDAGIDGALIAWLHDELVLEVRADQADDAAKILKQAMVDASAETFPGAPLNGLVQPRAAPSWGEAK
jgi:DNA polymerase family A